MSLPTAPEPRRMNRPRWLDVRVIGGVLLLVASVVVGAKVMGASSQTSPVWAAAKDLAAGTVLSGDDVVPVEVKLGSSGHEYLAAGAPIEGRVLTKAIRADELVPVSAVDAVPAGRVVSVAVSPERMPPGVAHGSVIDLYLTDGDRAGSEKHRTRLIQEGVAVQSVAAPSSGGLSGATLSRYQIAVFLTPADAAALVKQLPGREPLVVLRSAPSPAEGQADDAGAAAGDDEPGPETGTDATADEEAPADRTARSDG